MPTLHTKQLSLEESKKFATRSNVKTKKVKTSSTTGREGVRSTTSFTLPNGQEVLESNTSYTK